MLGIKLYPHSYACCIVASVYGPGEFLSLDHIAQLFARPAFIAVQYLKPQSHFQSFLLNIGIAYEGSLLQFYALNMKHIQIFDYIYIY